MIYLTSSLVALSTAVIDFYPDTTRGYLADECFLVPFVQFSSKCFYFQETSTIFPAGCQQVSRRCGDHSLHYKIDSAWFTEHSLCYTYPGNVKCIRPYIITSISHSVLSSTGLIMNYEHHNLEYYVFDFENTSVWLPITYANLFLKRKQDVDLVSEAYVDKLDHFCHYKNYSEVLETTDKYIYPAHLDMRFTVAPSMRADFYFYCEQLDGVIIMFQFPVAYVIPFSMTINDIYINFTTTPGYTFRVRFAAHCLDDFGSLELGFVKKQRYITQNVTFRAPLQLRFSVTVGAELYTDPLKLFPQHSNPPPPVVEIHCVNDVAKYETKHWLSDVLADLLDDIIEFVLFLLREVLNVLLEALLQLYTRLEAQLSQYIESTRIVELFVVFVMFMTIHRSLWVALPVVVVCVMLFGMSRDSRGLLDRRY